MTYEGLAYCAQAESPDGKDIIHFFFYSKSRANSKQNIADAKAEYRRKHGHTVNVLRTWRAAGLGL